MTRRTIGAASLVVVFAAGGVALMLKPRPPELSFLNSLQPQIVEKDRSSLNAVEVYWLKADVEDVIARAEPELVAKGWRPGTGKVHAGRNWEANGNGQLVIQEAQKIPDYRPWRKLYPDDWGPEYVVIILLPPMTPNQQKALNTYESGRRLFAR